MSSRNTGNPTYHRLTFEERVRIHTLCQEGYGLSGIGRRLGRPKSTISRELARFPFTYEPDKAQRQSNLRQRLRRKGCRKLDRNPKLLKWVLDGLRKRWSPEQISHALRIQYPRDPDMQVSYETIYTYIYVLPRGELRKELISYLRQGKRSRRPRAGARDKRGKIPEMISIEERPKAVEKRSLPGHWEGDLLMGKNRKSALGTLVERKTRAVILVPIRDKGHSAPDVRKAFERALRNVPRQMKMTLTYDQGREMKEHRLFTHNTRMKVYFCHPSSPWERGTCENTNGLLRHYFPKGQTDFSRVSSSQIRRVQDELNERPRKTLGFRTPKEVFNQEILKSLH